MARLVLEYGHPKNMCYDELGLYTQNRITVLGSIVKHDLGRYMWLFKRKIIFIWTFYSLHINLILKFEMTIFIIGNFYPDVTIP
jgi:hypothetical protein